MSVSAHTIVAVSSLILSSLTLEYISQPRQEILTECVCWCLILFSGKFYFHFFSRSSRHFNTSGLCTIAFGATLLCLSCSIQNTIWSTAPLLSLVFIIIRKGSSLLPDYEDPEDKGSSAKNAGTKKTIFLCVYAAATMIVLIRGDPLDGLPLKVCWLFSQIVLYWGLFDRVPPSNDTHSDNLVEALHTITELAHLMVLITVPLVVLWWRGVPTTAQISMISILKAFRWIAVLVLSHESRLSVPAWTTIFAVCTNTIWRYPQGWQAPFTIVGALVALYHVTTTFPQSSLGKRIAIIFALCPLWAFGARGGLASQMTAWGGITHSTEATAIQSSHHPIYKLVEEAKARFANMQLRQSRSLHNAVTEYSRRYGRLPPPGFDKWYQFMVDNEVQLIDEYDYLTKSLEPFWQMSPKVLRDYVDQALSIDGANLNTLVIKDHKATLSTGSFQHAQLIELLKPVVQYLPDLKAALNEFDEPRVLIPHDMFRSEASQIPKPPSAQAQPIYFGAQDKQRIWESVTISCAPDSIARSALIDPKTGDLWPPFISNLSESQDICQWPASASTKHGFLSSPSTFHFTHSRVPIMATAKLSSFHDIMMPSSYYFQNDIAKYDEAKDPPWEQKKDLVYWRGSGTGGHWTKGSWKMGHRQRFANFTNSAKEEITLLKESTPGKWTAYKAEMSQVIDKFLVKFSNFIQCDDEDCKAEEDYFHKVAWDANGDANQYKILYNLDGNSFSGRYYRFLKSNSLVFMQALFKEWHDDRLVPWVHFVPISLGMEELPEATRYLLDDPQGKVIAAKIASDSREWTRQILRPIDLTAAYFRIFLEYARLLDDNRDTMSCCQ